MDVYTIDLRIRNSDVDLFRRLRVSTLLTILQEAAIAHVEAQGLGRETTLDRGLLWIVTLQRLRFERVPVYDERIRVSTWVGKTMHVFFPRYYRVTDEAGSLLAEGSALWTLMDAGTRSVVFPKDCGIAVPAFVTGLESPLPRPPRSLPCTETFSYTVRYSDVDLNGHMNNVRYLDLAQNLLPERVHQRDLRDFTVEYTGEAKLGETIRIDAGRDGDEWYMAGEGCRRTFRLRLRYAPESEDRSGS